VLCCVMLCYDVLCCVMLCCVVLCCVVLCCVVLCCVVLCYVMLCYIVLYYIMLYCIVLHCGTYTLVPTLPSDLADLKAQIIAAVKNIDAPTLTRVWQELEYRIDVCRVTSGGQIERL
jgi:hypothetical protein